MEFVTATKPSQVARAQGIEGSSPPPVRPAPPAPGETGSWATSSWEVPAWPPASAPAATPGAAPPPLRPLRRDPEWPPAAPAEPPEWPPAPAPEERPARALRPVPPPPRALRPVPPPRAEPPVAAAPPAERRAEVRPAPASPVDAASILIPVALGLILLATFVLRLWGIRQGLPYSYNVDEESHFVPKAITFFSHGLNPNYFLNPPAYSYALNLVFELWFGSRDAVMRAYAHDPTTVFVVARVVASALGTIAVWLTYLTGKRLFDRGVGLLAAAVFGLAFLPIFYSHLALNDVPTLAPVALSLYGAAGIYRRGRGRDYLVAGIGVGLAAATKYTGGITLLCVLAAILASLFSSERRHVGRGLVVALLTSLAAFVVANPYSILDFNSFTTGVQQQATETGAAKLGSTSGGVAYYLWTFTWGFGWVPTIAAAIGSVLLFVRRQAALAFILVPAPIVFILFMGEQARFFGRWLMPIFPIVAILVGFAAVELVRFVARARVVPVALAGVAVAVLLLAQSVTSVIHNDEVLSRPDTLNTARAWMVRNIPAGAKVVIEPMVPGNWLYDAKRPLPGADTGQRWVPFNTGLTNIFADYKALPMGVHRVVLPDQYETTLRPHLLHQYIANGYCWVVVGSLQSGRAYVKPKVPMAIAYYAALARYGTRVFHRSPYGAGGRVVPFNFDWSIDYYPSQYRLPGPDISIYRLHGLKCGT